ncbi:MAG: hypothetical protein IJ091_10920 [Oscillospiraceae bacterium]|nr:hypothetical protein [Oscillospiraceae bacterium]
MEMDFLIRQVVFSNFMQEICYIDTLAKVRQLSILKEMSDGKIREVFAQILNALPDGNAEEQEFYQWACKALETGIYDED